MLYWYGNIPEETAWFRVRMAQWMERALYALIIVHFVLPWLGLVSRHTFAVTDRGCFSGRYGL